MTYYVSGWTLNTKHSMTRDPNSHAHSFLVYSNFVFCGRESLYI